MTKLKIHKNVFSKTSPSIRYISLMMTLFFVVGCGSVEASNTNIYTRPPDIILQADDFPGIFEKRDGFLLFSDEMAALLYGILSHIIHNFEPIFIEVEGEGDLVHVLLYREINYRLIELFRQISEGLQYIDDI